MRNKEICNFFLKKKKNVLDYVPINKIGGDHPLKNNLKKKEFTLGQKKARFMEFLLEMDYKN